MSTWYQAKLGCSVCAAQFDAPLLKGAHAQRAPQFRQRAIDGTLNVVQCPSCEARLSADVAMVYTDVERGEWIYVARPSDLPSWREIERTALELFDRTLSSSPLAASLNRTNVRLVFGTDELRERLMAWNADLHDGVLECLKLRCLRDRADLRGPDERITARAFEAGGIGMVSGASPGAPRCSWTVPRAHVEDVAADPRWRAEFPELFEPGFVSCDRYLR